MGLRAQAEKLVFHPKPGQVIVSTRTEGQGIDRMLASG